MTNKKYMLTLLSGTLLLGSVTDVLAQKEPVSLETKKKEAPAQNKQKNRADHTFYRALMNTYDTNSDLQQAVKEQYEKAEAVPRALADWRPTLSLKQNSNRTMNRVQPQNDKSYVTQHQTGLDLKQNLFKG